MISKNFEKIKRYYNEGLWNEARVKNMLIKDEITEEEYDMIIGKENEK